MPTSIGYAQLQPKYILGAGQSVGEIAEHMVGSELDLANQLREHLPFYAIARGGRLLVPRVAGLATATVNDGTSTNVDDSVSKLVDPPEEIEVSSIEGTVEVSSYAREMLSSDLAQVELHLELKKIAIRVAFWQQFFKPKQAKAFRGLPDLVAQTQVVKTAALSLDGLDVVCARVTEASAEMDRKVLVMSSRAFVRFARLTRASGASLQYAMLGGRRYAVHNGVPVLVSDYVPQENGRSRVWCMTLGLTDKGVFGVVPEDAGENGLVVEEVSGARSADAIIHRVRWYCSLVLGHSRGLACLDFDATASELPD